LKFLKRGSGMFRKQHIDTDQLLNIKKKPKKGSPVPSVSDMEQRIRAAWNKMGFEDAVIDMGLNYAHGRVKANLRYYPPGSRERVYAHAFKRELKNATLWLLRVKEEIESAL